MEVARPSAGTTFDLTLSLNEAGGESGGVLEFNSSLFDTGTVERTEAHFESLLAALMQDPDARRKWGFDSCVFHMEVRVAAECCRRPVSECLLF